MYPQLLFISVHRKLSFFCQGRVKADLFATGEEGAVEMEISPDCVSL
jgi:hypothetical protein